MASYLSPLEEMERLMANPEAEALFDHLAVTLRLLWRMGLTRDEERSLESRVWEQQARLLASGVPTADLPRAAAALRAEVEALKLGRDAERL